MFIKFQGMTEHKGKKQNCKSMGRNQHQKAFAQIEGSMSWRLGFMKQVSLKLMPERCQCGGRLYSKWEAKVLVICTVLEFYESEDESWEQPGISL